MIIYQIIYHMHMIKHIFSLLVQSPIGVLQREQTMIPPLIDGSMPNLMQCNGLKPFWEELYGGTASAIWLPRKEQPSMASTA